MRWLISIAVGENLDAVERNILRESVLWHLLPLTLGGPSEPSNTVWCFRSLAGTTVGSFIQPLATVVRFK